MLSITPPGRAQSTTGSIYGTVVDATGAAIPGASVVVKEVRTGTSQTLTTRDSGEYVFQTLNPGEYTVTTTAASFKSTTQTGITLSSNQNVHINFALVAGATAETVEVQAGETLMDTRESQIGETIANKFDRVPDSHYRQYHGNAERSTDIPTRGQALLLDRCCMSEAEQTGGLSDGPPFIKR